jgi:uncharacterized phage-like protein YoqJ
MLNSAISVAFTGHRIIPYEKCKELRERLKYAILDKYHNGYRIFYNGLAWGFDMMAAEVLLSIRRTYPDIKLIAAIPFRGQAERFKPQDERRYDTILSQADSIEVLSEQFDKECYFRRDTYMIEHASAVIAFYDGLPKGGTYYTCRKAKAADLPIVNLYF